jgi:hypothetical protein
MPEFCKTAVNFFKEAGLEELVGRGIINGERRLLTGASAGPLIALMLEKGVEKLIHGKEWLFDARSLTFTNRFGGYDNAAPISGAARPGDIFRFANRHINPFYDKLAGEIKGAVTGKPSAADDDNRFKARAGGYASGGAGGYASGGAGGYASGGAGGYASGGAGGYASGGAGVPYASGKNRTENLRGAGEMNEMINALPLNRKERYWTSCVFPNIVCGDNFSRLAKLLNLIGVPAKFIKSEYSNSDILFYTEYSLKESALGWEEIRPLRRDTPDMVILLKAGDGEKFLVVIEAKMFDFVVADDLKNQLARQKPVIKAIAAHNQMSAGNHVHAALVYGKTPEIIEAIAGPGEKVISWKDILDFYGELSGNYFYEMLKIAAGNPQLITTKEAYLRRRITKKDIEVTPEGL